MITWLDINAPYWPCYEFAFPDSYGGRMPITRTEHDELQKITGVSIPRTFSPPRRAAQSRPRPSTSSLWLASSQTSRESSPSVSQRA